MEHEEDGKLPFLDVCITHVGNKLTTSVFRKKTHIDRYLNFRSHHHPRVKTGIISCLHERVIRTCNNRKSLDKEIQFGQEKESRRL